MFQREFYPSEIGPRDTNYNFQGVDFPLTQSLEPFYPGSKELTELTKAIETPLQPNHSFNISNEDSNIISGIPLSNSINTALNPFEVNGNYYKKPSGALEIDTIFTESTQHVNSITKFTSKEIPSSIPTDSSEQFLAPYPVPILARSPNNQLSMDLNDISIYTPFLNNFPEPMNELRNPPFDQISPLTNTATFSEVSLNSNIRHNSRNVENICTRLTPLITQVTPHKFDFLLVETLRLCSNDISQDELYNLLYNSTVPCSNNDVPFRGIEVDQYATTGNCSEGLTICSRILEIFIPNNRCKDSRISATSKNSSFISVNFEELRRTFFAIKILFDCVEEVDEGDSCHKTIPRSSLYKAYCMLCQKLLRKFKLFPKGSKVNGNIVLGMPQFGRLTRLVYPNLKFRRLGRRGCSTYHCVGLEWNKSIVDSEIITQLESDFQVSQFGKNLQNKYKAMESGESKEPMSGKPEASKRNKKHSSKGPTNVIYSFLPPSCKLPESGCSPRLWDCFPGHLPKQSEWSLQMMSRSILALKGYNIDIQPIIDTFYVDIFSFEERNILLNKFDNLINRLIEGNADDKGYMHLYLIILLLLFPVILATDKEVSKDAKSQLRKTLTHFISSLETKVSNLPTSKLNFLLNFSNIVRKMIQISMMSQSQIQTTLVKDISKEIAVDFRKPLGSSFDLGENESIEEKIFRAVNAASKAFKSKFIAEDQYKNFTDSSEFLLKIVKVFTDFTINLSENILKIPELLTPEDSEHTTFDLPFQIFKVSVQFLHEVCFVDPFVSKLSIQVIGYIILVMNKELKCMSFQDFGKRYHELSKSTFKTWWVYSSLLGEYMQILAEVVALSGRLS